MGVQFRLGAKAMAGGQTCRGTTVWYLSFEIWIYIMGLWSSGMTPHSHCGDGGSIPPRSTVWYFEPWELWFSSKITDNLAVLVRLRSPSWACRRTNPLFLVYGIPSGNNNFWNLGRGSGRRSNHYRPRSRKKAMAQAKALSISNWSVVGKRRMRR